MSNLPQNPYNNIPGGPPFIANPGPPPLSQPSFSQVPTSQLPPGYGQLKQDANFNSSVPLQPMNSVIGAQNHFNQSVNNSPAFNASAVMPPNSQSSPLKPIFKPATPVMNQNPNLPSSSPRANLNANPSPQPFPSGYPQQQQINNNAPPLIPSSQFSQPVLNGPPGPAPPPLLKQYPPSSTMYAQPTSQPLINTGYRPQPEKVGAPQMPPTAPITSRPPSTTSQPNLPYPGPPRQSPLVSQPGSYINQRPPTNGPPQTSMSGPLPPVMNTPSMPPTNGPVNQYGPPMMPPQGPPRGLPSGPAMAPPNSSMPSQYPIQNGPPRPVNQPGPPGPHGLPGPPSFNGPQIPPPGPQSLPPMAPPTSEPAKSNMQNRYPPMPQSYPQQMPPMPPAAQPVGQQYPQQYNSQGLTQQMGQLSVTKQGFDQLWGHHMIDLMQARHLLPEYPEDPPEIKLGPPFTESPNCSPEIFRCTVNRIPDTNSLLQKSRLPLGILIHPFKDLNYLPVIQCTTIVRCRACRTYINPFVYFVDAKRWKCNLCYRVNDLPEEFQYDPVSKSYGDPTRRPEVKSATIEFIAPGEYMLRPPQPAVYLFLMDVSPLARESGYLQVLCDTLKDNLEQVPGDARTQVGFICYDAHVHFYLMSDGLTRPKEMTVLDIDDVFLPSPESLLVNLGERRELVRELLSSLGARHGGQGAAGAAPASALGAALQAAHRLMAPTGGRITVFQTCLPNVGPGALSSREDPNARSSKEVAHLNPATDFYKRLALDCSGAQIAVDLFLLNSQYSDLATLSGISKFSGGSVYHLPLFKASRTWQAAQFTRMLTRYLTRKIGFEAVMRVRCTRGITIHTFHGNFFVRSTDLLSLPNVSPDSGFGMQLAIDESLSDLHQVCFQAALLYTSSKGERRIRVHTLALPVANNLTDVLYSADTQCIIGLLAKMAVDRCQSASMSEAREALVNVAIDALSAHKLAQKLPGGDISPSLHAPVALALLPMYLLALTKAKAFRTGLSTRLDDRVAAMCDMKSLPLAELLRRVHPDLYPVHELRRHLPTTEQEEGQDGGFVPDPPRLQLTAERLSASGAYLLDDGETMIFYICHNVSPAFLSDTLGVTALSQIHDESRTLPRVDSEGNELLHAFVDKLNEDRPYAANVLVLRDNSPSKHLFTERLIEDRVESAFSYYEFLQHVKNQVK